MCAPLVIVSQTPLLPVLTPTPNPLLRVGQDRWTFIVYCYYRENKDIVPRPVIIIVIVCPQLCAIGRGHVCVCPAPVPFLPIVVCIIIIVYYY